ncbi:redoxin domain-containing protein [Hyunsoonleella sp. SJ7]|uniref:Redoxin domain-containing protein n=1 Tax=Hyunsoonleella aquatilis TaxID=2762758 RepID=A0A923H8Y2_9FLAO|nr:redoxin domain-containing protein [Hyunsoonleella aquatilis]MBC3757077.1 redoxin domain-containing protein [Hyunsoonleella aquatilis]
MSYYANKPQLFKAPEFGVDTWVDSDGNKTDAIKLSDFNGKFKVVFCFQSWCRGCHTKGLPDLKRMVDALKENDNVVFLAIQTVFEGHHANTYEKTLETQKKYGLQIPFGYDAGKEDDLQSTLMRNYKTGGTPWFIFIDKKDFVVFSEFHLYPNNAIEFLKTM